MSNATIIGTLINNRKLAGFHADYCHSSKDEHAAAMSIICAGDGPQVIEYLEKSGATEL